jgi:hypothetical protein
MGREAHLLSALPRRLRRPRQGPARIRHLALQRPRPPPHPLRRNASFFSQKRKLIFRHQGKTAETLLGPRAPKWADAIFHPNASLEKLGIAPGMTVAILGDAPADFLFRIPAQAASAAAALRIFFAASSRDLQRVNARLAPLWIVYPKGQKEITQANVIAAVGAVGLVDVKVTAISPMHTALKFTLPKT